MNDIITSQDRLELPFDLDELDSEIHEALSLLNPKRTTFVLAKVFADG